MYEGGRRKWKYKREGVKEDLREDGGWTVRGTISERRDCHVGGSVRHHKI